MKANTRHTKKPAKQIAPTMYKTTAKMMPKMIPTTERPNAKAIKVPINHVRNQMARNKNAKNNQAIAPPKDNLNNCLMKKRAQPKN